MTLDHEGSVVHELVDVRALQGDELRESADRSEPVLELVRNPRVHCSQGDEVISLRQLGLQVP